MAKLMAWLAAFCIQAELMDPRESRYVLADQSQLVDDLQLLWGRATSLHDAPLLWEADRLPERQLLTDAMAFNRGYRRWLEAQEEMFPDRREAVRLCLKDTDDLYRVYDDARDANCSYYYVTVRRASLKRLRSALPTEAWWAGELPPCVPIWHFRIED